MNELFSNTGFHLTAMIPIIQMQANLCFAYQVRGVKMTGMWCSILIGE